MTHDRSHSPGSQSQSIGNVHVSGDNNRLYFTQAGLPTPPPKPAYSPERLEQLLGELEFSTSEVAGWQSTLPSGASIARPELVQLEQHLLDPNVQVVALLGQAGSGKSSLLATVCKARQAQGARVIGIRLDGLPKDARNADDLQRYLNLSEPVLDVVTAFAAREAVLVLIDQLDALCDLATTRGSRLQLILNTVERLAQLDHVKVVLALRPFEYQHDVRLRRLQRAELQLSLPAWSEVEPHVQAAGIDVTTLSADLREELRCPQALFIYLRLTATLPPGNVLETYHGMRRQLWDAHVEAAQDGPLRREALFDLARWIDAKEIVSRPISQMAAWRTQLNSLDSAGWLKQDGQPVPVCVAFRHQSLFEFVCARALIAAGVSIVDSVIQRQGASNRRRVRSVLAYYREEGRALYLSELDRLWHEPKLRSHLKLLLIDFIGQVQCPERKEIELIRSVSFDPLWQKRVVSAVSSSPGWFDPLESRYIPRWMNQPELAPLCYPLLLHAPETATPRVLDLLRQYFLSSDEGRQRSAALLAARAHWTEDAILLAQQLSELLPFDKHPTAVLVSSLFSYAPDRGMHLFEKILSMELARRLQALAETADPPIPEGPLDVAKQIEWRSRYDARVKPLHALFEESNHWVRLRDMVSTVPEQMMKVLLSALQSGMSAIARPLKYARSFQMDLEWIQGPFAYPDSLLGALRSAVVTTAQIKPQAFIDALQNDGSSSLMTIQILLLDGLAKIADQHPDRVVEYFRTDWRRMLIGPPLEEGQSTLRFLTTVAPRLDAAHQNQLFHIFWNWSPPIESSVALNAQRKRSLQERNREHRLRLLWCLDQAKLERRAQARIEEEERAHPQLKPFSSAESSEPRMRPIKSAMSASQMEKASDEAILRFVAALPDDAAWHDPRYFDRGGNIEASRELAALAQRNPDRGLRIARELSPRTHQRSVGMILEALARAGVDSQILFSEIEACELRGFQSSEYREYVASALALVAKRADQPGLPSSMIRQLQSWLTDVEGETRTELADDKEEWSQSILFRAGFGMHSLPHGNYPILDAVKLGLLNVERPSWDGWLAVLEDHVHRRENPQVWQALAIDALSCVDHADRDRATAFLVVLFETVPEILNVRQGIESLAHFQRWLPTQISQRWLESLLRRGSRWAGQAYGELLIVRIDQHSDDPWTGAEIDRLLKLPMEQDAIIQAARIGMAFVLAHLIRFNRPQDSASRWLVQLAATEDPRIGKVLECLFKIGDPPAFDPAIAAVLQLLVDHPKHLQNMDLMGLLDALGDYAHLSPAHVCELANRIVDLDEQAQKDRTSLAGRYVSELVELSIALQEQDDWRDRGLDLFERLQQLNHPEVEYVLRDQDAQPQSPRRPRPRFRRRST